MSDLALKLIEENKQTRSTFLDLGNCGLVNYLPEELFDCIWLEKLNLGHLYLDESLGYSVNSNNKKGINYFDEYDFSVLEKLTNLISLFITDSKIQNITSLSLLNNLKYLGLGNNHITDISPLNNLTNLIGLGLRLNGISNINTIFNLNQLEALDLAINNIQDIKVLGNFSCLKSLDLSENHISDIDSLNNLSNLLYLFISSNEIKDLTPITKLNQIQTLFIGNNKIRNIGFLKGLLSLEDLFLVYNEIKDFSILVNLKGLKNLYLDGNKIDNINFLKKLITLEVLSLEENLISDISPLESLLNIKQLNLSNNRIVDIEPLIKLTNLEVLYINNNPLNEEDSLVLNRYENHWGIIKNVLERLKESGDKIEIALPVKILLLGNHASGKSSLLHYLQKRNLKFSGKSTHLLKIELYPKNKPQAIFYDFGGQDFYHGIYRAFFSTGSAYLLLWNHEFNHNKTSLDANKIPNQYFNIDYWLGQKDHYENANSDSFTDPVFLIQTHAKENQRPTFFGEGINEKIDNSFFVSLSRKHNPNTNKKALDYLKSEIDALIESKKVVKPKLEWYINFYNYILTAEEIMETPVNNLLSYYTPENQTDVLNSLRSDLEQFHNQGMVLYYPKINPDIVWLNPSGLVNYIHNTILNKDNITNSNNPGVVSNTVLSSYNLNIIKLLQEQKVIFKHNYGQNGTEYIIPNYLPLVKSNDTEYELLTFGLTNLAFVLRFQNFIPFGLINQLICFFGNLPDIKKFWRDQLLFTFENTWKILIRIDFESLEIKVFASSKFDKPVISKLDMESYIFISILSLYRDITPFNFNDLSYYNGKKKYENDEYITNVQRYNGLINGMDSIKRVKIVLREIKSNPPKDLYLSNDDKYFVNYSDLLKHNDVDIIINAYLKNENTLIFDKTTPIFVKPYEIFVNRTFNKMKKIFVSYSNEDIYYKRELEKYLKPFSQFKLANSWSCEEINPGLWHDQIQSELESSDIVIFMLSINFINSDYILKEEVLKTIKAVYENQNKKIICVIVKNFPWKLFDKMANSVGISKEELEKLSVPNDDEMKQEALLKLSDYQFLPYFTENHGQNSKRYLHPLNKWQHEEDAFSQIVEKILTVL